MICATTVLLRPPHSSAIPECRLRKVCATSTKDREFLLHRIQASKTRSNHTHGFILACVVQSRMQSPGRPTNTPHTLTAFCRSSDDTLF